MHAQGQAAIDAFGRDSLEDALRHLERMEEANLEVMRIVNAVIEQYERGVTRAA
ncbi:Chemotaxis protein OS=Stutzerimonas stutzeri OX=316 GN=CXK95_03335 PE=3 SV=1 [Stutzerimonas stutzeri]